MFSVSPVAASSVAALRLQPVDTPERVASILALAVAAPLALDPRTTYAQSAQVADAVLSLVQLRTPAPDFVAPVPQQSGAEAVARPALAGDTRSNAKARNAIASGSIADDGHTETATASSSKAPDVDFAKTNWADNLVKAQSYVYDVTHVGQDIVNAVGVYVMCNTAHYRDYKSEHPSKEVHWISVDNKKIVSVWPKVADRWFAE